jgi:hypothetical protein
MICNSTKLFACIHDLVVSQGGDGDFGVVVPSENFLAVVSGFEDYLQLNDPGWCKDYHGQAITFHRDMESVIFSPVDVFCSYLDAKETPELHPCFGKLVLP